MEKNTQKNGLVNLALLLVVLGAGYAVARQANSLAGLVALVFIGLGVLVAAVSWFQMGLEHRERLEKFELDELAKGHSQTAMFESSDSEVFPARRSREQFERFFVPLFTAVLCLLEAAGAYLIWRWLSQPATVANIKDASMGLSLFALFALVLFLLGKFSATIARLQNHRLLRPGASYLLLGAYLCAAVSAGLVCVWAGTPKADFYLAHALCIVLALIAAETLITLVLEIYRPRVAGKIERPLYESRLVGLLGQPEGLITTAAQALDYQFGFKVSETWFYRLFVEKALAWLVILQLGVLFLSTGVVFIDAGEQGLLERFGKPVAGRTLLQPGPHVIWPWPIDKVYRFRTRQVQSFQVGSSADESSAESPVVLWTVAHTREKEENFLVANHEAAVESAKGEQDAKRTPPVSLLTGTIPVQFQITNLVEWAYRNEDASSLMQDVAAREIVRFLAGVDMQKVMSYGRLEASVKVRDQIQSAVDKLDLGARILEVGLEDLHPPVKVAPDYEKVVAATQTKRATILGARADQIKTNALARAQATNILNIASAERLRTEMGALASAALFTNQIPAYEAAPSVYLERAYLDTFVRATAGARKYVLLATNARDVLTFDLQDKIRPDILSEVAAPPIKK
ncbi:MAG TPA: protease modulator HflK [Verrucomicrobiae bacterium]|nr:protease modulator HflK [Verrucomicrobiae bacterium]